MATDTEKAKELLLQVVRGERPCTDLSAIGITMRLDGNTCHWDDPQRITVAADIHGLAKGLLAHLGDPRALREWALFIYASDVDLEGVEEHPAGDTVLTALWDASFGNPISTDTIRVLEELAHQQGNAA